MGFDDAIGNSHHKGGGGENGRALESELKRVLEAVEKGGRGVMLKEKGGREREVYNPLRGKRGKKGSKAA